MGTLSRPRYSLALATVALFIAHAPAQPPAATPPAAPAQDINRPTAARRLVADFTFDDPEPFAVPRHWDLAQDGSETTGPRAGYPRWNKAELDTTAAFQGRGSVKLATSGGSVCLRLQPGVIPVFPEAEYLITAKVRTQNLEHSRARLTARYLDKNNHPISASESPSELVGSAAIPNAQSSPRAPADNSGAGTWSTLVAPLTNGFADAAYIQIDLEILQPERFETADLGKHQVWPQDFSGQAWFDEVAVVQLPRVSITTGAPANIIERPARPSVSILIRDLTGESMTGELTLQDAGGRTVDHSTRTLDSGISSWNWTPSVETLGWYRATLELRAGGGDRRVGATHVDFAWVDRSSERAAARSVPQRDATRFGIIVTDLPPAQRLLVPQLVRLAGAGSVSIPLWTPHLKADQVPALAQSLVPLVDALKSDWRRISFSLPRVPDELAATARIEPERPLALFSSDPTIWTPYLDPLLDKFGQGVQLWQVGEPGAPLESTNITASLTALHSALSRLVPGPVIQVPWPAELTPPPALAADSRVDLLATVPGGIPAESLPSLTEGSAATHGASTTLVLQALSETQFSRHDSQVALVKQAVALWGSQGSPQFGQSSHLASAPNLTLVQPWDWPAPGSGNRTQVMPRAELVAYRNLSQRLGGRRLAGSISVRGATCYILAPAPDAPPGRTGALVAWQTRATPDPVILDAFLGQGPITLVDIDGNTRPLEADAPAPSQPGKPSEQRTHHIPLSDEPIFVEGVDIELALFAASFTLEPSRLPPTAAEHDLSVLLSNPWPMPVEGRITILEPGGFTQDPANRDRSWRINPRATPFSIAPGQTARIPLTVAFSAVEESGPKDFVAQVELAGSRDYGPIRLRTTLEIGLDSSPLDLSYQVRGQDIIVEAQVSNRSTTPATFELAAYAPGYARQKASISDLAPGASATRRFAFPASLSKLRGQRINVGMQDLESQARTNRSIAIE